MPPERRIPGSPEDWLARARGDLAIARVSLPDEAFLEDLCFHAQQAAEKALKAVLLQRRFNFRYVHDIDELLVDLEKSGACVPESLCDAVELTAYACQARYPGVGELVTFEEYEHALALAERIVNWAVVQVVDHKEPAKGE